MPAPTSLVIGATGDTGQPVVVALAKLIAPHQYRILGLTRFLDSESAKKLSVIPDIEMEEMNWPEIDAAWLKERNIVKAYIEPHNSATQFTEESNLHLAL
jgi:hypothetical protein